MMNYVCMAQRRLTAGGMIVCLRCAFTAVRLAGGAARAAPKRETDNAQGQQASGVPLFTLYGARAYPDLFEQTVAGC